MILNTQYLQHHLERRVMRFASECIREGLEDHGLICEIFARDDLSDEVRLSYIGRIEQELSQNGCMLCGGCEMSYLAGSPKESVREIKQKRWEQLHEMAVEMTEQKLSLCEATVHRFLEQVCRLEDDPARLPETC